MTNYLYIILPVIYGYFMQNFCPFVNSKTVAQRQEELNKTGMKQINDVVWPLLYLMIGFSWFFARDKASTLEVVGKAATKGSREAVSRFGKLFGKTTPSTSLDMAYIMFTLFLGWWMVTHSCTSDKRNAMMVLFLTTVSGIVLLYLITSYGHRGLFSLIPVIYWLFFANEEIIRDYYHTYVSTEEK